MTGSPARPISTYQKEHSGTLAIVGGGESALNDLDMVMRRRPDTMVMAVGYAAGFVRADFIVSDHYEVHAQLRRLQDAFGTGHYTTHASYSRLARKYPAVDHWWRWRRAEASSVQTAIRIGLHVGFEEIILCGCPLEHGHIQHILQRLKDGRNWPPQRDIEKHGPRPGLNSSAEILASFKRKFVEFAARDRWRGRVYSMGGFTQKVLGPPPWNADGDNPVGRSCKQWSGENGVKLVYPADSPKWPDPDTPDILKSLCHGRVCDVGCGTGRCADVFHKERYIGVDINKAAIDIAVRKHPGYAFDTIAWDDPYPNARTYLFYTTLLHIPDRELLSVLSRVTWDRRRVRVVVFETMGREFRNEARGNYQRDPEEYTEAMETVGLHVKDVQELPSLFRPYKRHFLTAEAA